MYRPPFALILLVAACRPDSPPAAERPAAIDSILAQLTHTPIVAIAEQHRSRQVHDFLRRLVNDPGLGAVVNDIVVEFGNVLYQPVVDRFVAGQEVPMDSVRLAWRNTTQWLVWDSPLYEQFFLAVRESNRHRAAAQQIRIVLGDPPIEWSRVRTSADYQTYIERDSVFAAVVEREVLVRHRTALLIIGGGHLQRRGPDDASIPHLHPGAGELLHQRDSASLFVVWTIPADSSIAAAFGFGDSLPLFRRVAGSPYAGRSFSDLFGGGIMVRKRVGDSLQWVPMGEIPWPPLPTVIDALLFLGSDTTTVQADPATYRDSAYVAELRRRAPILSAVYGFDFLPGLEAELQ